ncbi:MAG: glutamine-hydrolyzing GMP synthase, partial [Actinomycetota bacterium]|nr:glutamine-hydrolyzing GMP synthase [Actinomycetota bacterium]
MTETESGSEHVTGVGLGAGRQTIAVLDYGGQYVQLIARRVRESRVYCEIFPHDVTSGELAARGVIGVILSGGPASVYDKDAPLVDPAILDGRFPVLGICYGMHLMAYVLPGGEVVAEGKREFGPATVAVQDRSGIFDGLADAERAWMSHGDSVRTLPDGFHAAASTDRLAAAAMSDGARRFGVQF